MKKALCVAAVAAIFILSVSAAVAATARDLLQEDIPPAQELYQQVVSLPQTDKTAPALPEPEQTFDQATSIRILDGETIRELTMQEYLQGVVLGEMPVTFELEALRAQAVAARTFTLKTSQAGKSMTGRMSVQTAPAAKPGPMYSPQRSRRRSGPNCCAP